MFETNQLICCGVLEISGFPESRDDEDRLGALLDYEGWDLVRMPTKAEVVEYVQEELIRVMKAERDRPYSHIIVNLIKEQKALFGTMLRRLGFKMVGHAVNGNTGNRVWMYVKLRPEKVVKKRKARKGEWNY